MDYATQSVEKRLDRMSRTPDEIAAAIAGLSADVLSRRPDGKNWAANEIICHLRDIDEVYLLRARTILDNDHDVKVFADPTAIDRMAVHRQYSRSDAAEALRAFRWWREQWLAFARGLTPAQLQRGCVHPSRGRLTIDQFVAMLPGHDDNHLDQLRRALDGRA
jgi:hypothetical protein